MFEKRLIQSIKILVYLTFLTPLIVMGETFIFPFVFPKAIFFRILVEVMFGLYLILCLINKEYRPKKTPLFLALCFLFFVLFLSCIFGVDWQRSIWGNHERMSGWFTLIHFGVYFAVISNVFRNWSEWKWLLRWSLVISLLVGFTGLNFLLSDKSIMKIGGGGSLGNMIYLSNFVLFHVFIAWLLFRREEKRGWKIFAAAVGIIEILIMIYNGKRGPFLGLLVGLFIGILLYSLFTKIKKWRLVGLGLIGLAIILSGLIYLNRQSSFVQKIPMIGQLANISFQSGTGETRAMAWQIAYKAWKEKPVFGWGVENFYYAFNKYYNPKSLEHGYYETWFDRSHNIFLDYLSTSGILGFLAYLSLFIVVFWQIFKSHCESFDSAQDKLREAQRSNPVVNRSHEIASASGLAMTLDALVFLVMFFIGYALQNFFVFDHLSSYLTFFLILAFVDVILTPHFAGEESLKQPQSKGSFATLRACPEHNEGMTKKKGLSFGWASVIVLVTLFLIYKTNLQPALANHRSLLSQGLIGQDFNKGIEKFQQTLNTYSPHSVDLRIDFARTLLSVAQDPKYLNAEPFKKAWLMMIEELDQTVKKHPLEMNGYLLLAQYYNFLTALDQKYFDEAEKFFQKAQDLSPQRQQVAYMWVKLKAMRRDYDGAIKLLEKTISENPKIADSYWYLGLIYSEMGDKTKTHEYLDLAFEKGKGLTTVPEMIFAANFYYDFKDYEQAKNLYEQALAKQNNNVQTLLRLSEIYAKLGDNLKAREMADRAGLYDPQAKEQTKTWLK